MRRLAAFVLSGYGQAAVCVAGFSWLALFLPATVLFSNASLGLFMYRFGIQRTVIVGTLSALMLSGLLWLGSLANFADAGPEDILWLVVLQWLPAVALAAVLSKAGSLSLVLQVLAVLGAGTVLILSWSVPDQIVFWTDFFDTVTGGEISRAVEARPELGPKYRMILELMTGFAVSAVLLTWVASLLLMYWWHFLLENTRGFRKEFTGIKLSKVIAVLVLALLAVAGFDESKLSMQLLIVMMSIFLIQGIATVHFLLSRLRSGQPFIVLFYVLLAFSPLLPLLPSLVGIAGVLENFMNLRGRMQRFEPENPE